MSKYEAILFDFDGTVTNSAKGIKKCIELTLDEFNKEYPDLSDYSQYVGPPLINTFNGLCGLPYEDAEKAIVIYRKHYNVHGIINNELYDGMKETLDTLKEMGLRIVVCTSKTEHLAREVAKYLKIEDCFEKICGSLPDGSRKEKDELIVYSMEELDIKDKEKVVLIGDSKFDALGAKKENVDFIGVSYGFGTVEQLKEAGAVNIANTPKEILNFI